MAAQRLQPVIDAADAFAAAIADADMTPIQALKVVDQLRAKADHQQRKADALSSLACGLESHATIVTQMQMEGALKSDG
jgi:hypothetical protein